MYQVEVRVVVWRSEDVVACNDFSGLRDLYCRMWMETDSKKKRDTDTHWRCKNGKVQQYGRTRRITKHHWLGMGVRREKGGRPTGNPLLVFVSSHDGPNPFDASEKLTTK